MQYISDRLNQYEESRNSRSCIDMEAISLCKRPGGCCPVFKKEGRKYSISDKGQEVQLTKGQLRVLLEAATKLVG